MKKINFILGKKSDNYDLRLKIDKELKNALISWNWKFAEGGRIGLKDGFSPKRRTVLKGIAALATLPIIGKYFKWAKPLAKAVDLTSVPIKAGVDGMPLWFKPFVNQIIKKGDDVTKKFATVDREIVHAAELPGSKTKVLVTQNLETGDVVVDIGIGKHGFSAGHYGQPVRLEYRAAEDIMTGPDADALFKTGRKKEPHVKTKSRKEFTTTEPKKITKTKEEFWVEEAEFTGGHPENIKFEESVSSKFGEHGSDFSEVEKFATGKVKKVKPLKKTKDEYVLQKEEGYVDEAEKKFYEGKASGGRVPLGGGGVLKGILALGKGTAKGEGKFTKAEVLLQMFENTIKQSKSAKDKKRFLNFIEEIKGKPELANDPKVWGFFTEGLPKNQKLVVYGDDTVDFWRQSDFGPHNIKTTDKFMKKHPNLSRDEAVRIQNMEPEDQILEMKRLETIRNRTNNATGGRVPMIFGGSTGLKAMWQMILKNLTKTQGKKINKFFPKMSAQEQELTKLGEKFDPTAFKAFNARELDLKLEGIDHLIARLKQDKKLLEMHASNKALKSEGLDFLTKHLEETGALPNYLKKYTDIDRDILQMETIKKNLIMKDRKLNATGGRVSLSAGGLAGMLGE